MRRERQNAKKLGETINRLKVSARGPVPTSATNVAKFSKGLEYHDLSKREDGILERAICRLLLRMLRSIEGLYLYLRISTSFGDRS